MRGAASSGPSSIARSTSRIRPRLSRRPRARRRPRCSAPRSQPSTSACSRTIRERVSVTTRRTSISSVSRPGEHERSSAPRARCSTPTGPRDCATSSAGSAPRSARPATSTSCSSTFVPRSTRSNAETSSAGSSSRSSASTSRGDGRWSPRSPRIATSRSSTASRRWIRSSCPTRRRRWSSSGVTSSAGRAARSTKLDATSSDDELHAARIKVKRARYAAELAEHELGSRGERFVDAAKRLQDVLGEHQDSVVAEERVTAWTAGDPARRRRPLRRSSSASGRGARRRASSWPAAWRRLRKRARKVGT